MTRVGEDDECRVRADKVQLVSISTLGNVVVGAKRKTRSNKINCFVRVMEVSLGIKELATRFHRRLVVLVAVAAPILRTIMVSRFAKYSRARKTNTHSSQWRRPQKHAPFLGRRYPKHLFPNGMGYMLYRPSRNGVLRHGKPTAEQPCLYYTIHSGEKKKNLRHLQRF